MAKRGKFKEAKDFSLQLLSLAIENGIEQTGIAGSVYGNLGFILCEWNDIDEGIRLINKGIDLSELGRDPVILASCQVGLLRALIFKAKQETAAALAELKLALALAEPGGLIMIFVSKGQPVAELLEEIVAVKKRDHDATKAGFSLSYAKKLWSVFKAATPPKIEGLIDPISERELEVLYLIAAGLSNREIADKLFISLNTVKTHTKNINSKLDVNSRIKAVARAKELGLL